MMDIDHAMLALKNRITALQGQLEELRRAKHIMEGLESLQLERSATAGASETVQPTQIRMAETVLQEAGHDLHVDDIIERVETRYNIEVKKNSLVATLSKYALSGKLFRKSPKHKASFGLLQWEQEPKLGATTPGIEGHRPSC